MRAVLRLQQIDLRDVESPSEGTYPTVLLGFVLINAGIAGSCAPVVVNLLYPGTDLPVRIALGIFAFTFIFLVDLLIVSVLPQPWAQSIAVRLTPGHARRGTVDPDVIVPQMPGPLARLVLLAPRVFLTVPLALLLGTCLNIVFNLAAINTWIDFYDVEQEGDLVDATDASWVAERDSLRAEKDEAKEEFKTATRRETTANRRVKCESGEITGSRCDAFGGGSGGGQGLTDAQTARSNAALAVTTAREDLESATTKLDEHESQGRPSEADDYDGEVDTSGLDATIQGYNAVMSERGFVGKYGFDAMMLLIDLTPLAFKLLKGWSDADERRWRRRYTALWREANDLREEADREAVAAAKREAEVVAAKSSGVRQAVAERHEADERHRVEFEALEARLRVEALTRQGTADDVAAEQAAHQQQHEADLADLDRAHARERHRLDLEAAAAAWAYEVPDPVEETSEPSQPGEPGEPSEPSGHVAPSEGTSITPVWDRGESGTPIGEANEFHGPGPGPYERALPPDSAYLVIGADVWIIGPSISSESYSLNTVRIAARYFGRHGRFDPFRDIRVVKILEHRAADYEARMLSQFDPLALRPDGNPMPVEEFERIGLSRNREGEPPHALVYRYYPRTDVLRFWHSESSEARGAVTWRDFAHWLRDTAGGVSDLWRQGFVLNDLKPQNIVATGTYPGLPGDDGSQTSPFAWNKGVHIDFGAVRRADPSAKTSGEPSPFAHQATPAYRAPELAHSAKPFGTFASDAFSLGSSVFKLASGRTPLQWLEWESGVGADDPRLHAAYTDYLASGKVEAKLPDDMPAGLREVAVQLVAADPAARLGGRRTLGLRPHPRDAGDQLDRLIGDAVRKTKHHTLPALPPEVLGAVPGPSGWTPSILNFLRTAGLEPRY
ncbi:DUF4407 domain-containing protein [Nocardioides zhouii]|nr:DUF4407 domain-containing protein [Nocardioides zhouii]